MEGQEGAKLLPERSSRGKRMHSLIQDEAEADEAFWNQKFFADEANDAEYSSESEEEDVVDADFDDPANEVVEPVSEGEEKEVKKKRKNVYQDPKRKPKKIKVKVEKKVGKQEDDQEYEDEELSEEAEEEDELKEKKKKNIAETDRVVRSSTQIRTKETEEKKKRIQEELMRKRAERARRKQGRKKIELTQEQLLEEAKLTEEYNKESLILLQKIEEEKKKQPTKKQTYKGPFISFISKDGQTWVHFTDPSIFPNCFQNAANLTFPSRSICAITGLPAKYVDPKTGVPYATIEAFKKIREQFVQKEEAKCDERISQLHALLEEKKKKKVDLQKKKQEEHLKMT